MSDEKTFGPFELLKAHENEPVPGDFAQRRRLAGTLKTLAQRLVRVEADERQLAAWADQLESVLEEIGEPAQRDTRAANRNLFTGAATADDIFHMMDYDTISGLSNPVAPGVRWRESSPEGVTGEVTFGLQYQGPPGRVHGGVLAWLLDSTLARALHAGMRLGVTGTLTTRYLAASPINEPLTCRGWIERQEGRKIFVAGGVWHGDTQTVEAEGIWLIPKHLS